MYGDGEVPRESEFAVVGAWSAVPVEDKRALVAVDAVGEGGRQLVVADVFNTSPFDVAVDDKSRSTRRCGRAVSQGSGGRQWFVQHIGCTQLLTHYDRLFHSI